jgi:hypothetical protein
MSQVIAQKLAPNRSQSLLHRRDLRHDVSAVPVVIDHPLQPTNLAFDATQPHKVARLGIRVDADSFASG